MARILVVDDDPSVRKVMRTILQLDGHSVLEAAEGREAIRKIVKKPVDLVLLDIMMPKVDGIQVLKRLQTLPSRRDIPVIVVTALHDPEQVQREIELGAVDHVAKPFDAAVLSGAVDRALSAPAAERQGHQAMLSRSAEVYGSVVWLRQQVIEIEQPEAERHRRRRFAAR